MNEGKLGTSENPIVDEDGCRVFVDHFDGKTWLNTGTERDFFDGCPQLDTHLSIPLTDEHRHALIRALGGEPVST